jgi:S1-C subfamily serine protease
MARPQVVRVFATTQEPDYDSPWQAHSPSSSTGSGVLIGPGRILTGAHVVAGATFLQVQQVSAPDKVVARIEATCHDADLALLTVDDPDFCAGVEPAPVCDLPERGDRVAVIGFPVGGEEVSVTEGVVSRIEVQRYAHSQRELLAVTIDAAINEGNSGGPVFMEDKVAGIAFQVFEEAELAGEMVPPPLIRRFLRGVDEGLPLGIPSFGVTTQVLENPRLRAYHGLEQGESGVRVTGVEFGSSAHGVLEPGDAVLSVGGRDISNNGTIAYRERVRTRLDVVLGDHYIGDRVALVIRRGGERKEVELELRDHTRLVPRSRHDVAPTYFVYGGLVFQRLSRDFLQTWGDWHERAPKEFLNLYYRGRRTESQREVVVLSQVLADELTVGYGPLYWEAVQRVNGAVPRDMHDFAERMDAAEGTLVMEMSSGGTLVLDVDEVRAAHARILERYQIPSDRSADLSEEAEA